MTTFWCEHAWLGGDATEDGVRLSVDSGVIVAVESGVAPDPSMVVLRGLTLPGLANAHSHAFHRALRSRAERDEGTFWTWRQDMYEVAADLTPDSYFRLARAVYGEMALAGITTVGEFHYLHHQAGGTRYDDPNAMAAALFAAAGEAGIRITLLDACYLSGGFGVPLSPVQERFSDGSAAAWAERIDQLRPPAHGRVGTAVHSVRAVDPEAIAEVASVAGRRPLHAHVSEQPGENREAIEAYARTPMATLAAAGALEHNFTAVHATHASPDDIRLLASSESSACLCPTTERDLADGIGPSAALRDAGVPLTLGSDAHVVIDLFEEARAVELNHRLATGVRGTHGAGALLRAATVNGQRSLGWNECEGLAPGESADFITLGFDSVRLAGTPRRYLLEAAVFAATAADVRDVVVAGETIVADGRHIRFDVARALADSLASL